MGLSPDCSDAPSGEAVNGDPRRESFVESFAKLWADPAGCGYRFLDLLSPDIVLIAPLAGRSVGRAEGDAAFRRTFALLPDLKADIKGWCSRGEQLHIELRFKATVGRHRVEWPAVDVFTFKNGAAVLRRTHFDPTRLVMSLLRQPRMLIRYLRVRLGSTPDWPSGASAP